MPMQTTDQWGSLLPKGLGTDQEATQATGAMRQSPWYQDWAKQNNLQFDGDQYGNAKLNDDQQKQLYDLALQHGIGLNNKYDQVDENGNISEAHHKLRNSLIALAMGGAAATGLGAAGIGPLSGLFGGAASAAGTGAGVSGLSATSLGLPVTAVGSMGAAIPAAGVGGLTATSLGLPVTSGLGTAGASGGGILSSLMSGLKDPKNLANLSRISDQFATDAQGNRALQGGLAGQYDRNMLTAQTDRNATEADAMKKLAQTKYILSGGYQAQPTSIQMNGKSVSLPTYGMQPQASSDAQKQGAKTLQDQLTSRLAPGGTYTPMPFSDYGTPGMGENIGKWIGTGLGAAGTIANMFK